MYAAMPIPALASIVARRVLHEGFADVGRRLRDRRVTRYIALGVALPIVICSVAYGIAWITGLTTFRPDGTAADATTVTRLLVFLTSGAVMVSIDTLILVPFALGEELGWRGYMLTRLIDAGVPRATAHQRPDLERLARPAGPRRRLLRRTLPNRLRGTADRHAHRRRDRLRTAAAGLRQHLARRRHARRLERGHDQRLRRRHPRPRLGALGRRIGNPARAHGRPHRDHLHTRPAPAHATTARHNRRPRASYAGRPSRSPRAPMTTRRRPRTGTGMAELLVAAAATPRCRRRTIGFTFGEAIRPA